MNPRFLSKIMSMLMLGVAMAVLIHQDFQKNHQMSKEAFLAKAGELYEHEFQEAPKLGQDIVSGCMFAVIAFGAYELLASGIYHLLRLRYQKVPVAPSHPNDSSS